jgi:hypothetical protein
MENEFSFCSDIYLITRTGVVAFDKINLQGSNECFAV